MDKLNKILSLLFILIFIFLIFLKNKENFESLGQLNNNTNIIYKFCKKLNLFDKPSENTLILRNFREEQSRKNKRKIKNLLNSIENLQKDKIIGDIQKINNYKCTSNNKAKKQLNIINKARQNIRNRNNVLINFTN